MNIQKLRSMNLGEVADELEQLRATVGKLNKQEPVIWVWVHSNSKLAGELFRSQAHAESCWAEFSNGGQAMPLYCRPVPRAVAVEPVRYKFVDLRHVPDLHGSLDKFDDAGLLVRPMVPLE